MPGGYRHLLEDLGMETVPLEMTKNKQQKPEEEVRSLNHKLAVTWTRFLLQNH